MKRQPLPKDAPFTSYMHRAGAYTVRDHVPYRLPHTGNLQLSPQPSKNLKRLLNTFTRLNTANGSDAKDAQNSFSEVDLPDGRRSYAASRSDLTDLYDGESASSRWSLLDNGDPHKDHWAGDERHSVKAQSAECDANHVNMKLQQAYNGHVYSVAHNGDAMQASSPSAGYDNNGNLPNSANANAPAQTDRTTAGKVFDQTNTNNSNRRYAASSHYKSCDSLTLSELSSTDVFERRLRLIREQNSCLTRRNEDAERVYTSLLNESNQKYAQVKRLCETLQTLVASYESLVSEQSVEIVQLKALLSEESKALERTRKQWQLYEETNRSLEQRLNSLQLALDKERKQIQLLKREENRPCDDWKQKCELESSKLRDCKRLMEERESRHNHVLTTILFRKAPTKATLRATVPLSDQLDALTLCDCFRRVRTQVVQDNGEKKLILNGLDDLCEDENSRLTRLVGLLFTSADGSSDRNYVTKRPMSFPFNLNSALGQGNERKLYRMLHCSFLLLKGASAVALRRTPISFEMDDENVSDRPVMRRKQHRVQQARSTPAPVKSTVTAYSAETDHAKRRRALKMRSQNSIDEESGDPLDEEEASTSFSVSVSSLRQTASVSDAQTDTLDLLPVPTFSHVAVNCDELDDSVNDRGAKKARRFDEEDAYRLEMERSLPECEREDETESDEENTEARSLLSEIDCMQTYEHVLAELLGQPELTIENRFSLTSARFHLDRSTLKKRAEICERQHKLAEKHMEQCLNETFKGLAKIQDSLMSERALSRSGQPCTACEMCVKLTGEIRKAFNRTEKCIFRFTSRAEQLGALQEELRTSNACEVMTACFESLKHLHGLVLKELEEAKKQIEIFEIDYKMSMEARRASEQGEEFVTLRKSRTRRARAAREPPLLQTTATAWSTLRESFSAVTRFGTPKKVQSVDLSESDGLQLQTDDQLDQIDSTNENGNEETVELQDQAVQCDLITLETQSQTSGERCGLKRSDSKRIYGITVIAFATLLFAVIYQTVANRNCT